MQLGKERIKNLIICLIISSGVIQAQSFSLKQAQDYAIENYFESVNAGLEIKKSKARIWENTAMGLLHVNASGNYRYAADLEFDFDLSGGLPPGQDFIAVFAADNISQGKIEASQLIFDGSYIVGLQAAKKYYEFTKLDKEKTNNEVKKMVSSSYYLVLIAEENIKVLEGSFENMEASIDETKQLVEHGFLEETELDQLMLIKSDLESTLQSAIQSKDVALKMLKLNLGLEISSDVTLSDSLPGIMEEVNMDDKNNETLFDKAMARYQSGEDASNLIEDFEKITSISPNQSAGWTCLSWLQLLCNENQNALRSARVAVKLNPQDPQSRINLTIALLETNSKGVREHIEFVKRALLIVPDLEKELKDSLDDGLNRKPNWNSMKKIQSWLGF